MRSHKDQMTVYIGYDPAEEVAWHVAAGTLARCNPQRAVRRLDADRLEDKGYLTRPVTNKGGQLWDCISDAPMATTFANARFLIPWLTRGTNHKWVLFVDCDVVFYEDPALMLDQIEPGYPVYVVKHDYVPKEKKKMGDKKQTNYACKNWSSVMLFDTQHPANERLTLRHVNELPGRELHRFCWLDRDEIGELDPGWNWLVNVQPQPDPLYLAHFTLGGPWLPDWRPAPHDDRWRSANVLRLVSDLIAAGL